MLVEHPKADNLCHCYSYYCLVFLLYSTFWPSILNKYSQPSTVLWREIVLIWYKINISLFNSIYWVVLFLNLWKYIYFILYKQRTEKKILIFFCSSNLGLQSGWNPFSMLHGCVFGASGDNVSLNHFNLCFCL